MGIPPQEIIYIQNQDQTKVQDLYPLEEFPILRRNELQVPVIEVFPVLMEAMSVALEIVKKGLSPHQISIIAKNEQDLIDSLNYESISLSGNFLTEVLVDLGINECGTIRFVNAVDEGKFLLVAIGNDWEAMKVQHVLNNIGNWQFVNHFKSILTLPV